MASIEDLRKLETQPRGFSKYGAALGNMRDVKDQSDLHELQAARTGFILNMREDRKLLHRAHCEAVGAMVSSAHAKVFFETEENAAQWLKTCMGEQWSNCGRCGGISSL